MSLAARWAVDPAAASAYEVVPGLWRLRLPLAYANLDHGNAWAVARDDGVLLVDAGMDGDGGWEALGRALAQAGFAPGDVRTVAITHAHADHMGHAARLVRDHGAELLVHPRCAHLYDVVRDPRRFEAERRADAVRAGAPDTWLDLLQDVGEEEGGAPDLVAPTGTLEAGGVLGSSLGDWEVVETPGHAPSHVAFVQRDRGLVLSGDTLSKGFAPWFDLGWTADPVGELLASLDTLEALDATMALPGHGGPITDLAGAIALQRDGVADRLRVAKAAAGTPWEIAVALHGEPRTGEDAVWNLGVTRAYLHHLQVSRYARP